MYDHSASIMTGTERTKMAKKGREMDDLPSFFSEDDLAPKKLPDVDYVHRMYHNYYM